MKQKCIRCIVRLSLDSLQWEDGSGMNIRLEGPPVFVRACVLGQLQHTHLHRADFPIRVNQSLTFDRILTNCRNPSLFNEVIRGEHVKVELIQVSPDYKGGKILARFESPAHSFLFPDSPGELQHLQLNKSRKYQCPPGLSYSTSTSLVEATVHSPVDSIFQQQSGLEASGRTSPSADDMPSRSMEVQQNEENIMSPSLPSTSEINELTLSDLDRKPSRAKASASSRKTTSLDRLLHPGVAHSYSEPLTSQHFKNHHDSSSRERRSDNLLKSYSEPLHTSKPLQSADLKPLKVKFKPPVPRFGKSLPPPPRNGLVQSSHSALYRSAAVRIRSHNWQECPRRSPIHRRNHSAPNTIFSKHTSGGIASSVAHTSAMQFDALHLELPPQTAVTECRPEFVVRHSDQSLIARREFCGRECNFSQHSFPSTTPPKYSHGSSPPPSRYTSVTLPQYSHSSPPRYTHKHISPQIPSQKSPARHFTSPPTRHRSPLRHSDNGSAQQRFPHNRTPLRYESPRLRHRYRGESDRDELVAKYLVKEHGNTREVSPTRVIEEKLHHLQEYCCECKRTSESLGEDDLSEDLERLKASLEGERNETLNRSARMVPQESVVVQIGPQDYWSKRMSEYTGKRHRVLFDETLEKIYNRLYSDAANSH